MLGSNCLVFSCKTTDVIISLFKYVQFLSAEGTNCAADLLGRLNVSNTRKQARLKDPVCQIYRAPFT